MVWNWRDSSQPFIRWNQLGCGFRGFCTCACTDYSRLARPHGLHPQPGLFFSPAMLPLKATHTPWAQTALLWKGYQHLWPSSHYRAQRRKKGCSVDTWWLSLTSQWISGDTQWPESLQWLRIHGILSCFSALVFSSKAPWKCSDFDKGWQQPLGCLSVLFPFPFLLLA